MTNVLYAKSIPSPQIFVLLATLTLRTGNDLHLNNIHHSRSNFIVMISNPSLWTNVTLNS